MGGGVRPAQFGVARPEASCADRPTPPAARCVRCVGTLICIRCAGVHRKIGAHVTKVLSIKIDNWSEEQLRRMESLGNEAVNAELEAEVPTGLKADVSACTVERLEGFIRAKYELGSFRVGGDKRIPAVQTTSEFTQGMIEFAGLLFIRLISCDNLPNMDTFGKTDAFCEFWLDDRVSRSKTCKNSLNPRWGEQLSINAKSTAEMLLVKVFDEDMFGRSTEIGHAKVGLSELTHDGQPMGFDLTLHLTKAAAARATAAPRLPSVAVELTYNPLS